ncbi:MAG TPA: hydroxymethylbilane synthase [Alphaproteobacteria bacterium]|nr:hydroxymethylbilane synthase [Alphaproteobacteria bacterium]
MKKVIRLGSRGSPLALIQAEDVKKKLIAAHPNFEAEAEIEIVPIRTTGDWKPEQQERTFIEMGGNKGLFTKEIEDALETGHIDMAVHSMKDVASRLPPRLDIAALLERLDPRDAFIGRTVKTLDELAPGSTVGSSSLRRQSQILARRPDLRVIPLRGNVDTRLKKLADGQADATILAVAGLQRLGAAERISSFLETDVMLPAAAQGVIGIEIRRDDNDMRVMLRPLNDANTAACVTAERAALRVLDGSCHTPIGSLAKISGANTLTLEVVVAKADGTSMVRLSQSGTADKADQIGSELGLKLKGQLPVDFFAA